MKNWYDFLGCEIVVPNFHTCEESVPNPHTCEESVPNPHNMSVKENRENSLHFIKRLSKGERKYLKDRTQTSLKVSLIIYALGSQRGSYLQEDHTYKSFG